MGVTLEHNVTPVTNYVNTYLYLLAAGAHCSFISYATTVSSAIIIIFNSGGAGMARKVIIYGKAG